MAVIRAEEADGLVQPIKLGGTVPASSSAPMVFKQVHLDGEEVRPPEPVSVQPPPAPAEPPPPPVFEVPGEILQGVFDQAVMVGLEEGKQQVFAELTILQERYAGAIDQLVGVSKELAAQNQVQLIGLACRIAEELVRHHLSVRPEHLLELIQGALADVEADEVTVHCCPHDAEYLTDRREELAGGAGAAFSVRVQADPALEYGDFRVETRTGAIDGRVSTAMEAVAASLTGGEG